MCCLKTSRRYFGYLTPSANEMPRRRTSIRRTAVRKAVEARLAVGWLRFPTHSRHEPRRRRPTSRCKLQLKKWILLARRSAFLDGTFALEQTSGAIACRAEPSNPYRDRRGDRAQMGTRAEAEDWGAGGCAGCGAGGDPCRPLCLSASAPIPGQGGKVRAYSRQDQLQSVYAVPPGVWNVTLKLQWQIFDGGHRIAELARARGRRASLSEHR